MKPCGMGIHAISESNSIFSGRRRRFGTWSGGGPGGGGSRCTCNGAQVER